MLEVFGHRSDNQEVHGHVAEFCLILQLVMKALGEPYSRRDPLFCFAVTRHGPTVSTTRARVVDTARKLQHLRRSARGCQHLCAPAVARHQSHGLVEVLAPSTTRQHEPSSFVGDVTPIRHAVGRG